MKHVPFLSTVLLLLFTRPFGPVAAQESEAVYLPEHTTLHKLESSILERDMPFYVFLPPSYEKEEQQKFPVVYHLHHNGGDHTSFFKWIGKKGPKNKETGERAPGIDGGAWLHDAMENGKIIEAIYVVPKSPGNTWNDRMGEVLVKELIPWVDKTYRTRAGRNHRMVQGISMGGAGSLLYGGLYPNTFGAALSIIGYAPNPKRWEELAGGFRKIRIRMDHGTHDEYNGAVDNASFALFLAKKEIAFQLETYPGVRHWSSQVLRRGGHRLFDFQREFFLGATRSPLR